MRAADTMRAFAITLLVAGIALAALPAAAQSAQTSFTLASKQAGGDFVWTAEGLSGNNPTLTVPASTEITITAKGDASGVPHNIKVGSAATSETFQGEDGEVTYTFTSPASGSVDYVCTIHPVSMKGKVTVEGSQQGGEPTDGEEKDSPGVALVGTLLAFAGVALLVARRRA